MINPFRKLIQRLKKPTLKKPTLLELIDSCVRCDPSGVPGSEIHLVNYASTALNGSPHFGGVTTEESDESIYLYRIPKDYYEEVENKIAAILIHEILHKVIQKIAGEKATSGFDDLFHGSPQEKIQFCLDS